MDSQLTLRLPTALARELARAAKARGVKKSLLVREAVAAFLARPREPTPEELAERLKPFIGCFEGDHEAVMADPLARQIYEHNWRE